MSISGRMLLRLEKSIKIPETGFSKTVGRHLLETHFKENFTELLTHLHQGMKMATLRRNTSSLKIVLFEGSILPFTTTVPVLSALHIHTQKEEGIRSIITYDKSISVVISVASFLTCKEKSGPFDTL